MRWPDRHIDLWRVSLTGTAAPVDVLDAAETDRAARCRCPRARHQFVQTRAALRRVLSGYLGVAPSAVKLAAMPMGKPMLDTAAAALHFNVSHSDTLAAIAVSDRPVGVDIERLRDDLDWRALLPLVCAADELDTIACTASFLALWTAKEAYVKARGVGLDMPLPSLHVGGSRIHAKWPWCDGLSWTVHRLSGLGTHVGAVLTAIDDACIRWHREPFATDNDMKGALHGHVADRTTPAHGTDAGCLPAPRAANAGGQPLSRASGRP